MIFFDNNEGETIFSREHINLNTVVAVVGFLGMFATFIAAWTTIQYKQDETQKWEERSVSQYNSLVARMDILQGAINKQEQTDYRVAQTEKAQDIIDQRIARMNESYTSQFTEIRAQLSVVTTQIAIANDSLKRLESFSPIPNTNRR